jgi:arginyl-tRNA synthetase
LEVLGLPDHPAADGRGESFYSDEYGPMIEDLVARGLARRTEGAIGIFPPGFTNKEGEPRPFIIQSRDGTYQYPTFDLAALRFRVRNLRARRIVYTHDSRQAEHFAMLFAVAEMLGIDRGDEQEVRFDYAPFGTVLGEDGKPLKTRSGENVKLADLIDEAEARAFNLVTQKNPDLPEDQRRAIAHAVGVGALKYADLSQNRTSDYVFSYDKMLAMDGNTAPYLMYAYARIKSIERKGNVGSGSIPADARIVLGHPAEIALAKKLLQFADVILDVAQNLRPNIITAYLYDLSQAFSVFYENCPVLKAPDEPTRLSRLMLCDLAARTLKLGLDLLGIQTLEQM